MPIINQTVEVQIQVDLCVSRFTTIQTPKNNVANYDERLRWSVNLIGFKVKMAKKDVLMVPSRTGFLNTDQKW